MDYQRLETKDMKMFLPATGYLEYTYIPLSHQTDQITNAFAAVSYM
jgi:hypothetical protein